MINNNLTYSIHDNCFLSKKVYCIHGKRNGVIENVIYIYHSILKYLQLIFVIYLNQ